MYSLICLLCPLCERYCVELEECPKIDLTPKAVARLVEYTLVNPSYQSDLTKILLSLGPSWWANNLQAVQEACNFDSSNAAVGAFYNWAVSL